MESAGSVIKYYDAYCVFLPYIQSIEEISSDRELIEKLVEEYNSSPLFEETVQRSISTLGYVAPEFAQYCKDTPEQRTRKRLAAKCLSLEDAIREISDEAVRQENIRNSGGY